MENENRERKEPPDFTGRLVAIDGIRGLAALAVVLYHLSGQLKHELSVTIPDWLLIAFQHGYLGVPIFFVLSGFVISASIKASSITIGYVGRFALRRSIRLDLVYWAAIALSLLLISIKNRALGSDVSYPSFSDIAVHSLYLQDVLQLENQISVVFWTLCLEIQFYIFFIFTMYVIGLICPAKSLVWHSAFITLFSWVSSMLYMGVLDISFPGIFFPYWTFFALGCLCFRSLKHGGWHSAFFLSALILSLATILWSKNSAYILGASATALFIYILAKFGWLKTAFRNKTLQHLGLISYSLYLTHPDIGWKSISTLKKFIQVDSIPYTGPILLVAGVSISIIFAYIFFKLIEKPSHLLSKKIGLGGDHPPPKDLRENMYSPKVST
jgi:peptidoglycan/LPS O-acetylase OafA/YrhL